MQVFVRSLEIRLRREVRDVNDQRVALPTASRVAPPLANGRGKVRGRSDRDLAKASLARAEVVIDRHHAGSLHDSTESANEITKIRKRAAETALAEAAVLR